MMLKTEASFLPTVIVVVIPCMEQWTILNIFGSAGQLKNFWLHFWLDYCYILGRRRSLKDRITFLSICLFRKRKKPRHCKKKYRNNSAAASNFKVRHVLFLKIFIGQLKNLTATLFSHWERTTYLATHNTRSLL